MSTALDWRSSPLAGRVLIEASAGTGKTYTIGLIYLRLLLERGLRVEQILVATFTERAAQELRDRLRARLVETEQLLARGVADENELAQWLLTVCTSESAHATALRRIRLARADLDRAPIGTIHALCQRILRDHPVQSGAALLPEKIADEESLLRECVEDFLRRRFLGDAVDADESDAVVDKGVDALINDVRQSLNVDAGLVPLDDPADMQRDLATLRRAEHVVALRGLANDRSLYAPRKTKLGSRLGEFAELLAAGNDVLAALAHNNADCIEPHLIVEFLSDKGRGVLVGHVVVECLQRVRSAASTRTREVRARVIADALAFCRIEIPRRARERDAQTFSMLIDNVRSRLSGEHASAAFADALFDSFPAALIDEFQDTDGRQFDIFDAIYRDRAGNTRGLLTMIGDPKQAIYGFRGGDLQAYLRARRSADATFALIINHRSSTPLIGALNALYARTQGGFDDAEIRYIAAQAGGRADDAPLTCGGGVVSRPLSIHRFAAGSDSSKSELDELAADDCVERIVALLNDPSCAIGSDPVVPGDIAVLVRTNDQIDMLRRRLVSRGVPCVGSGRGNVFDSDIARDLELVLFAVLHASDERAVRGALCTRLLGFTLGRLREWQHDEAAVEGQLERFSAWHALAVERGVQSLIQTLITENAGRLIAAPDGERVLTDLRHLGELLGTDDDARRGLESAYARLAALRRETGDDDVDTAKTRRLRIESDAARVQLMTVHNAKGLQFPVVFLPFAWRSAARSGMHAPKVLRFHDDAGAACIDLGSRAFDRNMTAHLREVLQEEMRLLYVAVTRAEYAVHLYWTDAGDAGFGTDVRKASALDVVLRQAQESLGLAPGESSLAALAASCDGIAVVDAAELSASRFVAPAERREPRRARRPLPAARPFQWLHSFSSLARSAPLTAQDSAASDEIETALDAEREDVAAEEVVADPSLLAVDAWRGRHFGNALHAILEEAGDTPVWPLRRDLLAEHLLPLRDGGDALEPIGRLVDRVRAADLGGGVRLIDLPRTAAVNEFEFQLPIDAVSLDALRECCLAHGADDAIAPSLSTPALSGMLTGFADLIFEYGGRYHVLDYKTNWLGTSLRDYAAENLQAAMREHHYPLQALIYTVALHRYLRGRLDGYTAERHLGDSWYLFVRAVGLGDGAGVWRRRWPAALIEALDDRLAGAAS